MIWSLQNRILEQYSWNYYTVLLRKFNYMNLFYFSGFLTGWFVSFYISLCIIDLNSVVAFFIIHPPLEFLRVSEPLTKWCASTLGAALLRSSTVWLLVYPKFYSKFIILTLIHKYIIGKLPKILLNLKNKKISHQDKSSKNWKFP